MKASRITALSVLLLLALLFVTLSAPFSLIFGKEFVFVPRPDGLNDRIEDLLQRRGIRL